MRKKFFIRLSLLVALVSQGNASDIPSVQDYFKIDADDIVIRPLRSGDKNNTWKIEDTGESEKFVQMFQEDKSSAPENQKISTIFRNQRSLLSCPWTIIQDQESLEVMGEGINKKLYLGVFSKQPGRGRVTTKMVGVINLSGFTNRGEYIWFEYMFDNACRGKGYGTRTVQEVTKFLGAKQLIPNEGDDFNQFPYKGLKAIVDIENKPSLAVILKRDFSVVEFKGAYVELAFPPEKEQATHKVLKPKIDSYLEKPPVIEEPEDGEENKENQKTLKQYQKRQSDIREELIRASFIDLVAMEIESFKKHFGVDDYFFLVDAVIDYPDLLEALQGDVKTYVREKIQEYYDQHYKGMKGDRGEDRKLTEAGKLFEKRKARFLSVTKKLEEKRTARTLLPRIVKK